MENRDQYHGIHPPEPDAHRNRMGNLRDAYGELYAHIWLALVADGVDSASFGSGVRICGGSGHAGRLHRYVHPGAAGDGDCKCQDTVCHCVAVADPDHLYHGGGRGGFAGKAGGRFKKIGGDLHGKDSDRPSNHRIGQQADRLKMLQRG